MSLLSEDDVKKIALNTIGSSTDITVFNYSLEPFSANKEGSLGSHSLLKVNIKQEHGSNGDCEMKTLTFFVKSLPESDEIQDVMDETFEEEINFYKNIKPLMRLDCEIERWSPNCYLAENNVLVFEDLRAQGFSMNSEVIMNEKLLKSALAALARFHSSSIMAEANLGKPLNEAFPKFFSERTFNDGTKLGQATLLGFKTIVAMADKFNVDGSFVLPRMYNYLQKSVKPQKGELNVLCHNDLWNNNIMFNEKMVPDCVIVDYQVLRYATPVADLSMLLYLNTTSEFRLKYENEMVNHYYLNLEETLNRSNVTIKIPSHESMLKTYKKYRLIGMAMAAIYFPALYLEPEQLKKLVNDPIALKRYMLCNRMEIIGPYLETNPAYAEKMKNLLSEVLNEGIRVL